MNQSEVETKVYLTSVGALITLTPIYAVGKTSVEDGVKFEYYDHMGYIGFLHECLGPMYFNKKFLKDLVEIGDF